MKVNIENFIKRILLAETKEERMKIFSELIEQSDSAVPYSTLAVTLWLNDYDEFFKEMVFYEEALNEHARYLQHVGKIIAGEAKLFQKFIELPDEERDELIKNLALSGEKWQAGAKSYSAILSALIKYIKSMYEMEKYTNALKGISIYRNMVANVESVDNLIYYIDQYGQLTLLEQQIKEEMKNTLNKII